MSDNETLASKATRSSRFTRASKAPSMKLTERDIEVVSTVSQYRLLSQSQIQRLHFPSKNTAQVRLSLLWQHHYLKRINTPGDVTSEMLYTLDTQGVRLLKQRSSQGLPTVPIRTYRGATLNPLALAHTLALADIRICAWLSAKQHGYQLRQWLDDQDTRKKPDKIQLEQRLVPIVPDAYLQLAANNQVFHYFLEYDSGTENLTTIERKLRAYQVYFQSNKCIARYTTSKIRVLFVVRAQGSRFHNLVGAAQKQPLGFHFWFAIRNDVEEDFFRSVVWRVSGQSELAGLVKSSTA